MQGRKKLSYSGRTYGSAADDNNCRYAFGVNMVSYKTMLTVAMSVFFALEPGACHLFHRYMPDNHDEEDSYVGSYVTLLRRLFSSNGRARNVRLNYRVEPNEYILFGDIGGKGIEGMKTKKSLKANYFCKCDGAGLVCLVPDSNGFYGNIFAITLNPLPAQNGKFLGKFSHVHTY